MDAPDPVRRQSLAERLDHRDATSDRRLVADMDAGMVGSCRELRSVDGEQRLVGGDKVLAGSNAAPGKVERHAVLATDEFDDNFDLGIIREIPRIIEPTALTKVESPVAATIPRRYSGDCDPAAAPGFDEAGVSLQQARSRRSQPSPARQFRFRESPSVPDFRVGPRFQLFRNRLPDPEKRVNGAVELLLGHGIGRSLRNGSQTGPGIVAAAGQHRQCDGKRQDNTSRQHHA